MVPLSASSNRPLRSVQASVKAPFLCPNISLSKRLELRPPRLTLTKGPLLRGELRWMASAMSSLPVPLSPVMSTEAPVGATRVTASSTSLIWGLLPMILSKPLPVMPSSSCRSEFRCRAVRMRSIRAILSQGLVMKSKAPRRMPSTARLMLPQAVMRMTGAAGANILILRSSSSPSSPVVDRE